MQKEVIIGIVIIIVLLLLVIIWAIFVRNEKYARPTYPNDVNESTPYLIDSIDNQNDVNAYTPNHSDYNEYYPNDYNDNPNKYNENPNKW